MIKWDFCAVIGAAETGPCNPSIKLPAENRLAFPCAVNRAKHFAAQPVNMLNAPKRLVASFYSVWGLQGTC
jgi:hypothetical protein